MGMDISIYKYKGATFNTNEEFEDYLNLNGYENEEKVCYWRKHYWLNDWFKSNSENSRWDDFILTKKDIQNFYKYCENLLNDKDKRDIIEDDGGFYCCLHDYTEQDIIKEILSTIKQIKPLLDKDFINNRFTYNMRC